MMYKVSFALMALVAAWNVNATTLSDNLTATTFGTELVSGTTWLAAGFQTDSSSYKLSSATFLIQEDAPGALHASLYSSTATQPANTLADEPGNLLGTLAPNSSFPSVLGQVTFGGNNLMLAPNTTYWLVLSAPVSGSYEWAYESGDTGSGIGFYSSWGISSDSGASWSTSDEQPMQMSVIATPVSATPEPRVGWQVLLGIVVVLTATRRFRSTRNAAETWR